MQLATARHQNVGCEEENLAAQGKKQVLSTPRHALGSVKNVATPGRTSAKAMTPICKPSLQPVSSNMNLSSARGSNSLKSHSPPVQPVTPLLFEDNDDSVEECNLVETRTDGAHNYLLAESNVKLVDAENDDEYFQKLLSVESYRGLPDIDEEDLTVESCGPDREPENYDHIINNGDPVLTEDSPSFPYEMPNQYVLENARNNTLEEMEKLFDSFADVIMF